MIDAQLYAKLSTSFQKMDPLMPQEATRREWYVRRDGDLLMALSIPTSRVVTI